MAMVKAFSYGSGSFEVASHLQNLGVDYLAVAYADEGVELRKNGIHTPILVLNPEPSAFDSIIRYHLEPEIYSLELLDEFLAVLALQSQTKFPIHIKLDTGMRRLGLEAKDLDQLVLKLSSELIEVKSIFSHLAASDAKTHDDFSSDQIQFFDELSSKICNALPNSPMRHICNSSAISRFPNAHFDMVRLGIGLYGISAVTSDQASLTLAGKLKTRIIQIRDLEKGDSLGYNRSFVASQEMRIGVIPIGYADGLFRSLGHGKIQVTIGKQTTKIIGTICMDMAFVDLSNLDSKTGEEVVIFQNINDMKNISTAANTIPYEILSAISHRVKRNFYLV
jgi:alanine racemase